MKNLLSQPLFWVVAAALLMAASLLISCGGDPINSGTVAQQNAVDIAQSHNVYIPQNDIEFKNYNARQILADNPSTIIWCTTAFPFPGSPLITSPVVGKLTSGNKRPYPVEQVVVDTDTSGKVYFPEIPDPNGMYGNSGEYRYGFTPAGLYVDYYAMPTFCTNELTIWQKEATIIVSEAAK